MYILSIDSVLNFFVQVHLIVASKICVDRRRQLSFFSIFAARADYCFPIYFKKHEKYVCVSLNKYKMEDFHKW